MDKRHHKDNFETSKQTGQLHPPTSCSGSEVPQCAKWHTEMGQETEESEKQAPKEKSSLSGAHKRSGLPSAANCCSPGCKSCRKSFSSSESSGWWWLLSWMLALFWALLSLSLLEFWLLTRAEETPIPVPALRPTRAQPWSKTKPQAY